MLTQQSQTVNMLRIITPPHLDAVPKKPKILMHNIYSNCSAEFHNTCQVDWQQPGINPSLFKGVVLGGLCQGCAVC